jgi:hypothetical protein
LSTLSFKSTRQRIRFSGELSKDAKIGDSADEHYQPDSTMFSRVGILASLGYRPLKLAYVALTLPFPPP